MFHMLCFTVILSENADFRIRRSVPILPAAEDLNLMDCNS